MQTERSSDETKELPSLTAAKEVKNVQTEERTASEFLRSVSNSESASTHWESFPTIRVFQSAKRQRIANLLF